MKKQLNLGSSYKKYLDTDTEIIDEKSFKEINYLYMKFLVEKVLDGHKVTLPSRMGILYISGKKEQVKIVDGKITGLAPDWVGTKKLWDSNPEAKKKKQLLYLTNEHTQGIRYKWKWSKKGMYAENKTLYSLKMSRMNKRYVKKYIDSGITFIVE